MASGLELVRRSDVGLMRGRHAAIGAGLAMITALPVVLAMLPISFMLQVILFVGSCALLGAVPTPRPEVIDPDDVADPQLRHAYASVLAAGDELERLLATAPAYSVSAAAIRRHCRDAIRLCARIAPVANRRHVFLVGHDAPGLARRAAELRERAAGTADAATASALLRAAEESEHQIAVVEGLTRTRDRLLARLEQVHASLRAFAATVVEQQMLEDEQRALAGEAVGEHVDAAREELAVITAGAELDAA